MGFFSACCSAVGSFCSSVGSAISSGFSSLCGGISSLASSVGSMLSTSVGSLATILGPLSPTALDIIISVVIAIGNWLGLNEEEEKVEELGERAMHPDAKKPEDFDSIEAYIQYLGNDIEIDKEALEKKSPEEKVALALVGTSILVKGIEEKTGMELSPEFLLAVGKCDMKSEEVKAYIDSFQSAGITDMKEMVNFLDGKSSPENLGKTGNAIYEAIEKQNPDLSPQDVDAKLDKMMADLKAEG